jgi:hypothetical protein
MFSVIRPDFEVVKEGWIFNKIKYLQIKNVSIFYFSQVYARFWTKMGHFYYRLTSFQIKGSFLCSYLIILNLDQESSGSTPGGN